MVSFGIKIKLVCAVVMGGDGFWSLKCEYEEIIFNENSIAILRLIYDY